MLLIQVKLFVPKERLRSDILKGYFQLILFSLKLVFNLERFVAVLLYVLALHYQICMEINLDLLEKVTKNLFTIISVQIQYL